VGNWMCDAVIPGEDEGRWKRTAASRSCCRLNLGGRSVHWVLRKLRFHREDTQSQGQWRVYPATCWPTNQSLRKFDFGWPHLWTELRVPPVGRIVAPNCQPEPVRDFPIAHSYGPTCRRLDWDVFLSCSCS
jgi:hypothetical protein